MKIFISDLSEIINQSHIIEGYVDRLKNQDLSRYHQITDCNRRMQFLIGRMMIYDHFGDGFHVAENGKLIADKRYLSLAHSKNLVILGVSDSEIGVDVEDVTKNRNFIALAKHCHFEETTNNLSFYKNFTQYEADYKIGKAVSYHEFVCWRDFIICIASETPIKQLECFKTVPFVSCDQESVSKLYDNS